MKDFIFSKEFSAYRKHQVEAIVGVIREELTTGDPALIKGHMKLARKILRLPAGLVKDKELQQSLNRLLQTDFNRVFVELSRKGIIEEE